MRTTAWTGSMKLGCVKRLVLVCCLGEKTCSDVGGFRRAGKGHVNNSLRMLEYPLYFIFPDAILWYMYFESPKLHSMDSS